MLITCKDGSIIDFNKFIAMEGLGPSFEEENNFGLVMPHMCTEYTGDQLTVCTIKEQYILCFIFDGKKHQLFDSIEGCKKYCEERNNVLWTKMKNEAQKYFI